MPPPGRHGDRFVSAALWSSVVLRMVAVVGRGPFVYVDSIDYERLDFTGRSRRPWVTPLLYRLVDDLDLRVLAQGFIGAVAWVVLAREIAVSIEDRVTRRAAVVAVLALSLTTSITNWDTAILSESLALSSSALLMAAYLRLARLPSAGSVALVAAASGVWVFTRQSSFLLHCLVLVFVLAVVTVGAIRHQPFVRLGLALVGALTVVALAAGSSYGRNVEIRDFNLAMVIGQRVVDDPEALAWFRAHDMPVPPTAASGQAVMPEPLLADEAFAAWVGHRGPVTYVEYLASHPWSTLTAPLEDLVADRPAFAEDRHVDQTMLSPAESYGSSRPVIPEPLEALLFGPGATGTVLATGVAVGALTILRRRSAGWEPRWPVPLSAIGLQLPALVLIWHTSTAELGRLALVSAVILRIGLLVQLAFLVDGWRTDRAAVARRARVGVTSRL